MANKLCGVEVYRPPTFAEQMAEGKSLEDGLAGSMRMHPDPYKLTQKISRTTDHEEGDHDH